MTQFLELPSFHLPTTLPLILSSQIYWFPFCSNPLPSQKFYLWSLFFLPGMIFPRYYCGCASHSLRLLFKCLRDGKSFQVPSSKISSHLSTPSTQYLPISFSPLYISPYDYLTSYLICMLILFIVFPLTKMCTP